MGGGPSGGGGGGQTSTNTVQKADPWEKQQPYLETGFERAESDVLDRPLSYFPGSTVTPFSPQTELALGLMEDRALEQINGPQGYGPWGETGPWGGQPWGQRGSLQGYMGGQGGYQRIPNPGYQPEQFQGQQVDNPNYDPQRMITEAGTPGRPGLQGQELIDNVIAGTGQTIPPELIVQAARAGVGSGTGSRDFAKLQNRAWDDQVSLGNFGSLQWQAAHDAVFDAARERPGTPDREVANPNYDPNQFLEEQTLREDYDPNEYTFGRGPGGEGAPGGLQGYMGGQGRGQFLGDDLLRGAQREMGRTLGGAYLGAGNPFFDAVAGRAVNKVLPAIDARFSGAGRYGSAHHGYNAALGLGDAIAPLAFQNYEQERGRQHAAMAGAPGLADADYGAIQQLAAAGGAREGLSQEELADRVARFNFEQGEQTNRLAQYMNLIQGQYGGQTTSSSIASLPRGQGGSPFLGAAGGGLAGYAGASLLGADNPGLWALGGAGLGGLAGYFG